MSVFLRIMFVIGSCFLLASVFFAHVSIAEDVVVAITPATPSVDQEFEWSREVIRKVFSFDGARPEVVKLSCLVYGKCAAGIPSEDFQYTHIQKSLSIGNCQPSKDLNEEESLACFLLQQSQQESFDRYYQKVIIFSPDFSREEAVGIVSIVQGYLKGGLECQGIVRTMVGVATSAWTSGYYQNVVDCKILFEDVSSEQMESDLTYFSLARSRLDNSQCQLIKDDDIKVFCEGPFPTPIPNKQQ